LADEEETPLSVWFEWIDSGSYFQQYTEDG